MRSQVLEASIKNSKSLLEELVKNMTGIKEAWQQVEREATMKGVGGLIAAPQSPTSLLSHGQPMTAAR
jgi:hypothetical protein